MVADIDFGDTPSEQLATLMYIVGTLYRDIHGNGQPGLKRRAETFMDGREALELEQEKRHKANTARLNIIIALLIAIAAYIAIVVSLHGEWKTMLDPHKVFHSMRTEPEQAQLNADGR